MSIFRGGFKLRCFQLLSAYGVATRQMPCRTIGKPEATSPRSSRTKGPFPSDIEQPHGEATLLSRDVVNPSQDPF